MVIAEIGVNFDGDLETARRMIDRAADCGVDAVKFQTFRAEEFISDRSMEFTYHTGSGPVTENAYAMFKRLELPGEWHRVLCDHARERGVRFLSSAADPEAADLLVDLGALPLKLASEDLINLRLLRHVAELGVPLLLSTGMAEEWEIERALHELSSHGAGPVTLLHCVSLYPTPPNQAHLQRLPALRARFGLPVGYSDHTMGTEAALAATALGAVIIEKHFTLDRTAPGPDHAMAADPEDMAALTRGVRLVAAMLGERSLAPSPGERTTRGSYRRGLVATRPLAKGTVLQAEDMALKRPSAGLHPFLLDQASGLRLTRPLDRDEPIHQEDLQDSAGLPKPSLLTTGLFLPYGRQRVTAEDRDAVDRTLAGDFLTSGPEGQSFEREFAQAVGASHAVSCSSGTSALHLATMALGIGPEDTAIVPAVTFVATANAVLYQGGRVVFSDVCPETGLMRPEDLTAALDRVGGRARLVLPVYLGGQAVDLPAIADIARGAGASVVVDACHALGGVDAAGLPVGSDASGVAATIFSLHAVKTLTSGEGGMVVSADPALAATARSRRNHALNRDPKQWTQAAQAFTEGVPNPWYYEVETLGYNYRLTDIQAALGRSQLRRLNRMVEDRRQIRAAYAEALAPLAPLVRLVPTTDGGRPSWHLAQVLIDFARAGVDRASVMARLKAGGIGTQVHYIPLYRQPLYQRMVDLKDQTFPNAEAFYQRVLALPLHEGMALGEVERVVQTLREVFSP
jgi:dTDP-4-amino-4,6-dideoxygalactose transaminase/sialic acid synthase SpsE